MLPGLKKERVEVSISQCVHYCGFRYGHGEYHPYETYVARLHRGDPLDDIRREFIDFLLHYRPRHLGEALGITLSRRYPLWTYPWAGLLAFLRARPAAGWYRDASRIPDVLTHFSDAGIPRTHIQREYGWLHGAYEANAREGYRPEKYGYPLARMLQGANGQAAYLVMDGNHRISALSASGCCSVVIEHAPGRIVALRDCKKWRGVRNGFYTEEDAARVFNAYFSGNRRFRTQETGVPAILE